MFLTSIFVSCVFVSHPYSCKLDAISQVFLLSESKVCLQNVRIKAYKRGSYKTRNRTEPGIITAASSSMVGNGALIGIIRSKFYAMKQV